MEYNSEIQERWILWDYHPNSRDYMYSTNADVDGWHFLKDNTETVVGMVNESASRNITAAEANVAKNYLKIGVSESCVVNTNNESESFVHTYTPLNTRFVAVGMRHHGNYVFSEHDTISLKREPDNPHDHNAIKIMANDMHVAYVARDDAAHMSHLRDFEPTNPIFVGINYAILEFVREPIGNHKVRRMPQQEVQSLIRMASSGHEQDIMRRVELLNKS